MSQSRSVTISAREAQADVLLLVGEHLDEQRRQATDRGDRPQIDIFKVETSLDAKVRDYNWLHSRAEHEPVTRLMIRLAEKIGFWHCWLALRALAASRSAALIYATGEDVGIAMALLLRLTGRRKPRLIMRLEEPVYGRTPLRRAIIRAIVGLGLARVDLTLTRTEAMVRRLQREFALPPERVRYVPDGVDLSFFSPDLPAEAGLVAIPEGPYLLSAGLELRDYATLIEAVRDLPVEVVIGAGSQWSRRRFGIAAEDLPPNVHVTSLSARQMRALYRSATIVAVAVMPTTRSCGISVALESLAMARPLVITRTEGLACYFEDGVTAALVPPGDVAALRARIVALLDNPAEAAAMAARGHKLVKASYTLERMVATFLRIFQEQTREAR